MIQRFASTNIGRFDYMVDISPIISPSGDFSKIEKLNVILNSWLNILTTPKNTADHDPEFGCGIQKFLFKPSNNFLLNDIKTEIHTALIRYDNRAKITNIDVKLISNYKGISISIFAEYEGEKGKLYFTATENSFVIHETKA